MDSSFPTLEAVSAELMKRQLGVSDRVAIESIQKTRDRAERSLVAFVKDAWHILEPRARYVHSWHIDAIAEHLEAVTAGLVTRLLINVPPGSMKSLLVSVFWPAWEWGPKGLTSFRYISTSFAESAVIRDTRKMRVLIESEWYQRHWPHVALIRHGELSFENSLTGTRDGVAFGSLTSKRGDRLIIDDPHSVEKAESANERERSTRRFREGAVNRLNDQVKSAIVVIMQRLHEADISGVIQEYMPDYVQLCLPMEYEETRHCDTVIGFSDPRTKDGELLAPERFPRDAVEKLKRDMDKWAWSGQYQQRPAPRGGGIFPYNGWEYWRKSVSVLYGRNENQFPDLNYIVGSLDPAFGEKQENDYSGFTIWGCFLNRKQVQQVILMQFWQLRLTLADLVERVIKDCRKMKVDRLLIEGKASGISVIQEIRRMTKDESFAVQQINPGMTDKLARANSLSHLFGQEQANGEFLPGVVWVPCETQRGGQAWPRTWAEPLMAQMSSFPKGKYDDGVDSATQALKYLRDLGLLKKQIEQQMEEISELTHIPPPMQAPLYPI